MQAGDVVFPELFMITTYIPWAAMVLGVLGAFVVATPTNRAKVIGFELWIYANVLWCVSAFMYNSIPLLILNGAYAFFNLIGIYKHLPYADAEVKMREELLQIPPK